MIHFLFTNGVLHCRFDSEALDYEHPGYEGEGYVGKSYPADAFSDGKERVIFPSKDLVRTASQFLPSEQ